MLERALRLNGAGNVDGVGFVWGQKAYNAREGIETQSMHGLRYCTRGESESIQCSRGH